MYGPEWLATAAEKRRGGSQNGTNAVLHAQAKGRAPLDGEGQEPRVNSVSGHHLHSEYRIQYTEICPEFEFGNQGEIISPTNRIELSAAAFQELRFLISQNRFRRDEALQFQQTHTFSKTLGRRHFSVQRQF